MKKNVMMRLASIMMVLVLMTSSVISGTFAKYVTADTATDNARVAKWGVTVTATDSAFGKYYYSEANGNAIHTEYVASTDTVKSSNGDNVVAPGTNGNMATIALAGTPEVDFNVKFEGKFSIGNKWTDGTGYYCPLVVKVAKLDGTVTTINGLDCTDAADFAGKVNDAIAACTFDAKAGTDLDTLEANACQIAWEWPFSTSEANDKKDTYLGDQAADGQAAEIYLEVTCTVTQID